MTSFLHMLPSKVFHVIKLEKFNLKIVVYLSRFHQYEIFQNIPAICFIIMCPPDACLAIREPVSKHFILRHNFQVISYFRHILSKRFISLYTVYLDT